MALRQHEPAGIAIAPAKQHRVRTIVIKVGAIIGAGAALGTVIALTQRRPVSLRAHTDEWCFTDYHGSYRVMGISSVKLVSFSGIDGAGKSTQIEAFCGHLRESGLQVSLFHLLGRRCGLAGLREHASLKAFKGDKGVGSPDNPIVRRDKNVRSWYLTAFRLLLYLLDACQSLQCRGTTAQIPGSISSCSIATFMTSWRICRCKIG